MSTRTNIEWCDSTFNGWTGCTAISAACDHCYAEAWSKRAGSRVGKWGPGAPRVRTSAALWRDPVRWNDTPFWACPCGWRGTSKEMVLRDDGHGAWVACPNCGAGAFTPARRRVFTASLGDYLDNEVPLEWLADLLDLIRKTPSLDWLMLTKRVGNWGKRLAGAIEISKASKPDLASWLERWVAGEAPENVWLGITVCNQVEAERDIVKLLSIPARIRFLSVEPMLGAINLERACDLAEETLCAQRTWTEMADAQLCLRAHRRGSVGMIDWVICGAESGPGARPMHPEWARRLRDQCLEADTPFLFKQWGEWIPISQLSEVEDRALWKSRVQAKPHEDQEALDEIHGRRCTVDLRVVHLDGYVHGPLEVNAFPPGAMTVYKLGKQKSGRLLDGEEHNGFPAAADLPMGRQAA